MQWLRADYFDDKYDRDFITGERTVEGFTNPGRS
jgi:hypothetical protein